LRYRLIFTQRRVLPLAVLVALAGAVVSEALWARIVCVLVAVVALLAAWLQSRGGAALVVDDEGYAVEERGREKLRVRWSEVQKARADAAEQALYLDTGDPARNLLVPPQRGYGFRFERADELYREILKRIPQDKIEAVARLDRR
jgi:hypothetical protein